MNLFCGYYMSKGFANLPTVVALAALMIAVGLGITAISLNNVFDTERVSRSRGAYQYAENGAHDALLRIARNKKYTCESGAGCPYTIEFVQNGCAPSYEGCATITVGAGVGTALDPKIVESSGRAGDSVRTVRVTIIFDGSESGEITSAVFTEIAP